MRSNYRRLSNPAVLNLLGGTACPQSGYQPLYIESFHTLLPMCTNMDDITYAPYVNPFILSADK